MNKFTKIKERIRHVADFKKVNKEFFFSQLGMTSASFRGDKIDRPINSNAIERLLHSYPDINALWLLTGKGDMFYVQNNEVNETQKHYRKEKQKHIPLIGTTALLKSEEAKFFAAEDVIEYYTIPKFEIAQIEFLFSIDNDQSLQSPYKKGDLLGCQKTPKLHLYPMGEKLLLIAATKQGILVRKLFPVENENQFECRAEDLSTYPSFNIDRTEIISLSIVLGVVRME